MSGRMAKSINGGIMGRYGKGFEKEDETPIDERTIDCVWCVNSETGEKVLMDRKTNKPVGVWKKNGTQQDL